MKKIRAYYKPDQNTDDWPMYFYPRYSDAYGWEWVLDVDPKFIYGFPVPFEDEYWVLQKFEDNEWTDLF